MVRAGVMAALKTAARALPVAMVFDERDRGRLTALLDMALKAERRQAAASVPLAKFA